MKIGILAVQGAFAEHKSKLEKLGARCVELRKKEDLDGDFDGLVLPGGESTVQGKLLRELEMFEPLKEKIQAGMPVFHSHDVAVLPQSLCRGFGHGHGAVPASGAAQSDGQTVAAFGIIVGQGKAQ